MFWIISFLISNLFLAYILGVDELKTIIFDDPRNHTGGLIAIIGFATVFFAVFAWFREQVCTAVCPYGRLQGVLMDKNSIVVAYDKVRGEERAKIKKGEDRAAANKGDCIDCHQCVHVCPTGIDIRNGTQLECVNCTLCMDACDHMMDNVGLEKGLIRYDSEEGITTGKKWRFTTRIKAYIALMIVMLALLIVLIFSRSDVYANNVLRVRGTTYQKIDETTYSNIYYMDITNKTAVSKEISLRLKTDIAEIEVIGGNDFMIDKQAMHKREFVIKMQKSNLTGPRTPIVVQVFSNGELVDEVDVNFSGPGY